MNNLTIIIPFLNEGIEIENTIRSIRETAGTSVNILLINDCSTDEFQYKDIAVKYSCNYYLNAERLGVAASRDIGIAMIETPYFLLLDGHMRFYDSQWVNRLVGELEQNDRVLLCCQTKALNIVDGQLVECANRPISLGASVNFSEKGIFLEAEWLWKNVFELSTATMHDIPCVLGAAYSGSKRYWQYLKGLNGLEFYGSDEVYISIKVWLEGGRCKLLENIEVGHIYREEAPYELDYTYRLYNKLLIAELILPEKIKKSIFARSKATAGNLHTESCMILHQHKAKILEMKSYYQQIFTKDFSHFETLNESVSQHKVKNKDGDAILTQIANYLLVKKNEVNELGFLRGKMGIVLFLNHYAQYSQNIDYRIYAEELLYEIFDEITLELPVNFSTGYCGIGWGIGYLIQLDFIDGDADEVLEDIDLQVMERDPLRINDLSIETGLAGIILYVLSRISSANKNNKQLPFDNAYLSALAQKVDRVLSQANVKNLLNTDIFLEYAVFNSLKTDYNNSMSVFDFMYPFTPEEFNIDNYSIGLAGISGIGIKLILDRI